MLVILSKLYCLRIFSLYDRDPMIHSTFLICPKNRINGLIDRQRLKHGLGQLSSHLSRIFEIVYSWQNFHKKKSHVSVEALDIILYGIIQKWISVTDSLRIDFAITKRYILYSLLLIFYYPLYSLENPEVNMKCLLSIIEMISVVDGCSLSKGKKNKDM